MILWQQIQDRLYFITIQEKTFVSATSFSKILAHGGPPYEKYWKRDSTFHV
jgi:hypothetical protein